MDKIDKDEIFKEIDLIQACIERMSKNSFMLKGWALTILAGMIAVLKSEIVSDVWLLCVVTIPFVCFWLLDAYFIQTERKYRKLYEWMIRERKIGNMEFQYDLNPQRFRNDVDKLRKTMMSKTLCLFYAIPIMSMIVLAVIKMIVPNCIS